MIKILAVKVIIPIFAIENHIVNNTHFDAGIWQKKEAMANKAKEQV